MIRSLYNGAAAMQVLNKQHEQIAENLANVNVGGHRRAEFSVAERSGNNSPKTNFGLGPELAQRIVDFSQGNQVQTGRNLDVSISGDGFFALEGSNGEELYSRNGRFRRDPLTGQLKNSQNLNVLGDSGPIQIPLESAESSIEIGSDGTIVAGDQEVGKLKLVAFENNAALNPISQTVFQNLGEAGESDLEIGVRQKFYESSNVNPTSELIGLIVGGRQYEAIQKATRTISDTMEQSIRS